LIISKSKIEIPDLCPKDCIFKYDLKKYGQQSICTRCPVLCCKEINGICLIGPENFRKDWAEEWKLFFDGKTDVPKLFL